MTVSEVSKFGLVCAPIFKFLRIVDGVRPFMGKVYQRMCVRCTCMRLACNICWDVLQAMCVEMKNQLLWEC